MSTIVVTIPACRAGHTYNSASKMNTIIITLPPECSICATETQDCTHLVIKTSHEISEFRLDCAEIPIKIFDLEQLTKRLMIENAEFREQQEKNRQGGEILD